MMVSGLFPDRSTYSCIFASVVDIMANHDSLVKKIVELLEQRQQTRRTSEPENETPASATVNSTLRHLFPSSRLNSGQVSTPGPSSTSVTRRPLSRSRKNNPYSRTQRESKTILKDVILLPDPQMNNVPRGLIREEFFLRNLVAIAIEIPTGMTEHELKMLFEGLFKKKLASDSVNSSKF